MTSGSSRLPDPPIYSVPPSQDPTVSLGVSQAQSDFSRLREVSLLFSSAYPGFSIQKDSLTLSSAPQGSLSGVRFFWHSCWPTEILFLRSGLTVLSLAPSDPVGGVRGFWSSHNQPKYCIWWKGSNAPVDYLGPLYVREEWLMIPSAAEVIWV